MTAVADPPAVAALIREIAANSGEGCRREISTSAPPAPGRYELAIELLTGGEVSTFFHGYAKVGTEVEIRGPLGGHFIWEPSMPGDVVLLSPACASFDQFRDFEARGDAFRAIVEAL